MPGEVVLEELSVVGQGGAGAERATGPVSGYRATRSATGTKTDTALRDSPQTINVVPRRSSPTGRTCASPTR